MIALNGTKHGRTKSTSGEEPTPQQLAGRKAAATRKRRQQEVEQLKQKIEQLLDGGDSASSEELAELREQLDTLRQQVADIAAATPRRLEVQVADREPVDLGEEHVHPVFEEVLELLLDGDEVMLVGPTGSGKTHLAEQIAKALPNSDGTTGRDFDGLSCSPAMSEAAFFGRLLPVGKGGAFEFVGTRFLELYENGGVFLLDEMDAADPSVLLKINSALSNGWCQVEARRKNPRATRHPDFVCIAAANTFGTGADRQYCGRNQLDLATLERFCIGRIEMDYDRNLERSLCPDGELLETLWRYRDAIAAHRLARVVSTRFILKAYKAKQRGRDMEYIESKLFFGWRDDEVRKVKHHS